MITLSGLDNFNKCVLDQADELHATIQNLYMNIQKLKYFYSSFRHFKNKARDALVKLKGIMEMVKEMSNWKVQFEKYPKKPLGLRYFTLQFYQTTCSRSNDKAKVF